MLFLQILQQLKFLAMTVVGLLFSACSGQVEQPPAVAKSLEILVSNPIPVEAAAMQNISGFDVYADGRQLYVVFTATAAAAKYPLIAYSQSADGGLHWSAPVEIGKQFNLPVESKQGTDIQIAASGEKLLIVWQTTGELPGMGPLVSIYSLDGGKNWQKGGNPTGGDTDQSHPELAADAQGLFHLVWLDDRDENGYQGLRYARSGDVGAHWDLAQTIDDSSCSCCWNRFAVGANGLINVLYRDMQPRDMALAQSVNAGASWSRRSTVGEFNWQFDGCPHNGGGLSQAADGVLHSVVWTGAENRVGLYYLQSADAGKTWSQLQAIGVDAGAFHSDIAAHDAQRLAVVWDALGAQTAAVFIADSANGGIGWSSARMLSTPGTAATHPRLVATATGWLALWTEQASPVSRQLRSAVIQ